MSGKSDVQMSISNAFLASALDAKGRFFSQEEFFDWFREQSEQATYRVQPIPFAAMDGWHFEQPSRLVHKSGKFFSIEGIRFETDFGTVPTWDQPIINQPEIGILGIISKMFDGSRHFLMQAKMEPGTINFVQLAPTVQATRSNFTRVHQGKTPLYLEYFLDRSKSRFLVDQLQTEQASRFLFKRNRNMIVDVEDEVPVHSGFCWLTLGQIKNLLLYDNIVNMDARTVMSCIHLGNDGPLPDGLPIGSWNRFSDALFRSMRPHAASRHTLDEILSWLTELKASYNRRLSNVPLDHLREWVMTDYDIHHDHREYFSVVAVKVQAEGREVTSWTQPLLHHPGEGLNGFVLQRLDGVLHFLVRACLYPGNRDIFDLAPTVSRSNYRKQFGNSYQPPFLHLFRDPKPEWIRYTSVQSEEGGRFLRYQNHYVILEAPETEQLEIPGNFIWMTLSQIHELIKYGYFNIEARNLLACLNLLAPDGPAVRNAAAPDGGGSVFKQRNEMRTDAKAKGIYSKDLLPSPTFCILPWTHLFADELGVQHPCCFGLDAGTPNIDNSGEPYIIYSPESIVEGWNSDFMRRLRRDMLQGRRPESCRLCFRYEDLGMVSYRQNSNEDYQHCIEEISDLDEDGRAPIDFRSIDLRLGNVCNLRCRMCSPKSSKGLLAEWSQLLQIDSSRLDKFNRVDWYAKPEVWQLIEKYSPDVERLTFAGGEPLLVRQHFDFLRRLIAKREAGRVHLSYITNATTLPAEIYDVWPHFKTVRLVISLDGFGEVDEFIRYPTNWAALHHNLMTLDQRAEELNLREIGFNTTVQVYNILSLTELFEYTFQFRRIKPYPDLSILNQPSCFSIQILPPELKQAVVEQFAAFRASYSGRWPQSGRKLAQFERSLHGVIEHMLAKDRQSEIADFIQRNAVFDTHRGQSAKDRLPALRPLFERFASKAHG